MIRNEMGGVADAWWITQNAMLCQIAVIVMLSSAFPIGVVLAIYRLGLAAVLLRIFIVHSVRRIFLSWISRYL